MNRPLLQLNELSKSYKGLFEFVERRAIKNLEAKQSIILEWDDWIYAALDLKFPNWHKGLKVGEPIPFEYFKYLPGSIGALQSIGLWRYTKSIYKFESNVGNLLLESQFDKTIPAELLTKLPEWVIYIDTENLDLDLIKQKVYGIWFNVTRISGKLALIATALLESGITKTSVMLLDQKTIDENITDFINTFHDKNVDLDMEFIQPYTDFLKKSIQLILFICQPEPDVLSTEPGTTIAISHFKKIKGKVRLFEAQKTRKFDIGTVTARLLDRKLISDEYKPSGMTVAPHIRRGHWHGYWSGSKDNKKLGYKWILPIIVNADQ